MSVSVGTHLTTELVAAYVERSLPKDERDRVEAHMADCDACRFEVGGAWRLLSARRRRRRMAVGAPLVAATAAIMLVVGSLAWPADDPDDGLRAPGEREAVASITPTRPLPDARIAAAGVELRWEPVAGDARYTVMLTTEAGATVWTTTTSESAAEVPSDVELAPGSRYFWYVDALLPDGRSLTTGVQSFTTR